MTELLLKEVALSDCLTLVFHDRSNRYFGNFHRILIEVDARIVTEAHRFTLRYQRPLKRMGVPGERSEVVKDEMIDQFVETVGIYMRQADFIDKILRTLAKPGQKVWRHI